MKSAWIAASMLCGFFVVSAQAAPTIMTDNQLDRVVAGTGNAISGDLYGNTSNPSGDGQGVLPSWSPGPWVCDYSNGSCAGSTDPGGSVGDYVAPTVSGGTASPTFANGTDPNIDFSAAH